MSAAAASAEKAHSAAPPSARDVAEVVLDRGLVGMRVDAAVLGVDADALLGAALRLLAVAVLERGPARKADAR